MKKKRKGLHRYEPIESVVVPIAQGVSAEDALRIAESLSRQGIIYLFGVCPVKDESAILSATAKVRHFRAELAQIARGKEAEIKIVVKVALNPWEELVSFVRDVKPKLTIMSAEQFPALWRVDISEMLSKPPSDVAIIRGPVPAVLKNILIAVRGGRYAELALRAGLLFSRDKRSKITALHLEAPTKEDSDQEALLRADSFRAIKRVLRNMPSINVIERRTENFREEIISESKNYELVIIGSTAKHDPEAPALGWVAQQLMEKNKGAVMVMRTKQPFKMDEQSPVEGASAIAILIDKWLAESTFHRDEFKDLELLLAQKHEQRLRISVVLPSLNEEKTIGKIITSIQNSLIKESSLVDELVLIDSNSTDSTREIARSMGVPVHIHQNLLPNYGVREGKGEALWKSLYVTTGDIIIWVDSDIENFHPGFVYGILGPLLLNPGIKFSKGFYKRPLKGGSPLEVGAGGRVTELTARPLINLFYPELSGVLQPLSGEYGGRREVLEQVPFFSGYGVEIGLLIEILQRFGLSSIAQVDLKKRIHRNQPLLALGKMSFAIIQAVLKKLETRSRIKVLDELNTNMKIVRSEAGHLQVDISDIQEIERPPMIELMEYQKKRGL